MVKDEIEYVKAMGAKIITGSKIGKLAEFSEKYDAIFIGIGAYRATPLCIEGADIDGVYQAASFLKDRRIAELHGKPPMINLGRNVIVIGGGNTAIDAAQSARLAGCEVEIFYRRSENDMPAFKSEIQSAKKNGVRFHFNHMPLRFSVTGGRLVVTFAKTMPGSPDDTGRPAPIMIDSSGEDYEADNILLAIGQEATFEGNCGIATDSRGLIIVDKETGATSMPGVFAGGDAINGGATAVQAVADGRCAALGIDKFITENRQSR